MKIYLAGPMSGIPGFNHDLFDSVAAHLRSEGHDVFSPADHDRELLGEDAKTRLALMSKEEQNEFRRKALAYDLNWICRHAEAVALLPGWEFSTGASAEHAAGKALRLQLLYVGVKLK